MRRYLIHHSRAHGTFDLVADNGSLSVERFYRGARHQMTVSQFETSEHAKELWGKLRAAIARAEIDPNAELRRAPASRTGEPKPPLLDDRRVDRGQGEAPAGAAG